MESETSQREQGFQTDPIIGVWDFTNSNVCTFKPDGNVELCGQRIALWKHVAGRNYVHLYMRGYFGGASDALHLSEDGQTIDGLASGFETRKLQRVAEPSSASSSQQATDSIVGVWDFMNSNVCTFTSDGWVELCGARIGAWVKDRERCYTFAYLRGHFGGESDAFTLSENGQTIDALISNGTTRQLLRVE